MNIEKIKTVFKDINTVALVQRSGQTFLEIEVNLKTIAEVENISRQISTYLDENEDFDSNYFLDIFSSGTDHQIKIQDLENYQGKNLEINLKHPIKDKESFEGTLIKLTPSMLTIKWNAKGQFRNQEIALNTIDKIKTKAKI